MDLKWMRTKQAASGVSRPGLCGIPGAPRHKRARKARAQLSSKDELGLTPPSRCDFQPVGHTGWLHRGPETLPPGRQPGKAFQI